MIFLLLLFLSLPVLAQSVPEPPALIINVDQREYVSLNGYWQTIVDPYETGYYNYRYEPRQDGYFVNRKPRNKSDLVEYDFDAAGRLSVPGDWNSQREELFLYEGTIWYKKSFDDPRQVPARLFVYFGAANYRATVYLNGEKLGEHEGGFTPFNFEISEWVKPRDNFLVVKVDNRRRREAVPTVNTDWWNYGGLTRRVLLVEVPQTFIRDYFIQLKKGSFNEVSGWVQLDGPRRSQQVTVQIPHAPATHTVRTDSAGFAEIHFRAGVTLWRPEAPVLYQVRLVAETDTLGDQIGFRSIETRGSDLLLNGEPLFLRGISIHEEAPLREGRAGRLEDARTLLSWARELGCNFVRLAHYPHNEFMLREADRLGLLVWGEIPVYWTILWERPETNENARRQLSEMITRDKNRAAVIIWSVANETPRGEARLSFLRGLIDRARSLDPTRLITAATELNYRGNTLLVDDPLGEYLDVIGANEYVGWYGGSPADPPTLTWRTVYDKPLVISEFGGGALQGYHGDRMTRWTEEYQAYLYRQQIAMLKEIPFLRGVSPWILVDFRSPRRPLPDIQDFWNRKGLLSEQGVKKQAFYVLQEYYHALKENRGSGQSEETER